MTRKKKPVVKIPSYPWENPGPVSLLLTCDICKGEIKPETLGTTGAETVLCKECVRRAVASMKGKR